MTINVQYIHHLSTEENFGGSGPVRGGPRRAASAVFRFFFVIRRLTKRASRRVVDATRVSFAALSQNVTCKSGRRTPAIGARFERGPHLRDAPLRGLEVRHADEPRKEQRQFVFRKDAARAASFRKTNCRCSFRGSSAWRTSRPRRGASLKCGPLSKRAPIAGVLRPLLQVTFCERAANETRVASTTRRDARFVKRRMTKKKRKTALAARRGPPRTGPDPPKFSSVERW